MVDLDPSAMTTFAAIARARGVRGAAALLGMPRSTVSRRLAELEEQVGAPLVVRTSRRFSLTALGHALLAPCEELEDLMRRSDDLVRRATDEPSGRLRVSASPAIGSVVLPEVVAELVRLYPRLSVDVLLSVDHADLRRGHVDVALRAGALDDASDLFATRLGSNIAGCWASPEYVALRGVPRAPADLAHHECIVVGMKSQSTWSFRKGAREERIDVTGRVRVDTSPLAVDLATRGVGIVRAARPLAAPHESSGALVPILEPYWPETVFHVVHGGPNPPPPKVRVFLELAKKVATSLFTSPRRLSIPHGGSR